VGEEAAAKPSPARSSRSLSVAPGRPLTRAHPSWVPRPSAYLGVWGFPSRGRRGNGEAVAGTLKQELERGTREDLLLGVGVKHG
jgi:hypothetical protein